MGATPRPIRIYHPTNGAGSFFSRLDLKWLTGGLLLLVAALVAGLWYDRDQPVKEIKELKQEVRDLKSSVAGMEEEMRGLTREIRRVLDKGARGEGGSTRRPMPTPPPSPKR